MASSAAVRYGRAQRGLTRLQRQPNLVARFVFFTVTRQREHPVHRIPELRKLLTQIRALLGRAMHLGVLFLEPQR
jgi:hypothetical protein